MSLPRISYCPGTLAEGYQTYSPLCLKQVFKGKKVSHILPFDLPLLSTWQKEGGVRRISISGVQEKFSVILGKNGLRLVNEGEQGEYILKPNNQLATIHSAFYQESR